LKLEPDFVQRSASKPIKKLVRNLNTNTRTVKQNIPIEKSDAQSQIRVESATLAGTTSIGSPSLGATNSVTAHSKAF
jgi:hypothetical protein